MKGDGRMKCNHCEEELQQINFFHTINGGIGLRLDHKEPAVLYACTSRDCKNCGVVIVVPEIAIDED